MNFNVAALWSMVRYVVVAIGAFVVGIGWATADDWAALLSELDVVVGAVGSAIAGVIGVLSRVKLIAENVKK